MRFVAFFIETLVVSLSVGVRMIPVLGITFYSLYMLFVVFRDYELVIFFIGIAIYMPLLMFLYLCAVRAGLAALRATTAPSITKLLQGAIRLMRFHFMVSNLIMMLVGVGGMGLVIYLTAPSLIDVFNNEADKSVLLDINVLINDFSTLPALVLVFPPLAACIAVGIVGTSLGATASWAAERGPAHDVIWGVAAQFGYLFGAATIVLMLPTFWFIYLLDGPFSSFWNVLFMSPSVYIGYAIYILWSICAVAAAMAVAYVKNLGDLEVTKVRDEEELIGGALDDDDIRRIRLARQTLDGDDEPALAAQ